MEHHSRQNLLLIHFGLIVQLQLATLFIGCLTRWMASKREEQVTQVPWDCFSTMDVMPSRWAIYSLLILNSFTLAMVLLHFFILPPVASYFT